MNEIALYIKKKLRIINGKYLSQIMFIYQKTIEYVE